MAMNKKEAAELAEAKKQALVNRALRWTDGAEPDLPPPTNGSSEYTQGFDYNTYGFDVYAAWSGSVSHGRGIKEPGKRSSASQNSTWLFSTELLALKAMRADLESDAANKLAEIDAKISELAAKGK